MAARKRRRGAPKSPLGTLLAILAAALIAGGAQLGWFDNVRLTPAATPLPGEGVYVTFIDVGQGDSTLAYCEGETLLIDAGVPGQGAEEQRILGQVAAGLVKLGQPFGIQVHFHDTALFLRHHIYRLWRLYLRSGSMSIAESYIFPEG